MDEAKKLEKEKGSSEIEDAYSELYDDVEALILRNRQPRTAKSLLEKFRPICERKAFKCQSREQYFNILLNISRIG